MATIDADYFTGLYDRFIGEEGERTTSHEMGHLFDLSHASSITNLMTQGRAELRGNLLTSEQLGSISKAYKDGRLNRSPNSNALGEPILGADRSLMSLRNLNGRRQPSTLWPKG